MRFLVDAQLPPALARMLVSLGHEAQHVADLNFQSAADSMIWDFALEHRAVLLTKDEDFPHRLHQSAHAINELRSNSAIDQVWSRADFHTLKREHFYHVGSSEDLRHPMLEALISNFPMNEDVSAVGSIVQPMLLGLDAISLPQAASKSRVVAHGDSSFYRRPIPRDVF